MAYFMSSNEFWMSPKQARRARAEREAEKKQKLGAYVGIYCFRCFQEGHYAVCCDRKIKKQKEEKPVRKKYTLF